MTDELIGKVTGPAWMPGATVPTGGPESWRPMTVDEYAGFEGANGGRLVKSGGVWWRAARPGFYRPLFLYTVVGPGRAEPPLAGRLGGYQHAVAAGAEANSYLNLFHFEDVQAYSIERVGKSLRKDIRKAFKNLAVREVGDVDHFIADGYPVYLAFYERSQYRWRRERTRREGFMTWARTVFRHPKIWVLGVYRGEELVGISLSFVVEDVVIDATMFATSEGLRLGASDLIWHVIRERAAGMPGIRYIYEGMSTGRMGIDQSKILRGCRVASVPAYYRMNPVAEAVARRFKGEHFKKLLGMNEDEVRATYGT